MSGPWAQACDSRRVSPDDDHAMWAAVAITQAMAWQSGPSQLERVVYAGAYLRAWRESLPEQGLRKPDVLNPPITGLLWGALQRVSNAKYWQVMGDASGMAHELRHAEALLRTWWKRQVTS